MTPLLSPNTQAILLLTAPLIVGRGKTTPDLLSPGEYKRLARHLRETQRQPADLLSPDATTDLLPAPQSGIDADRLQRLLGRGFLLSQAIEHWQARAIWVVSRADADYPTRVKMRLREDAPAILYGCGDISLLETGGLAIVGSRHVDDAVIGDTMAIGRLAARAGRTVVSGGARGIDQAAMRGALEAGGNVSGVLADSLEKTAMNREHRGLLIDGQLVLISPYDPSAGFNVGNAMQRNKLIYALADAALVMSSDLNKGGTWAGAKEQLDKLRLVPIYVHLTRGTSEGLNVLHDKGAMAWPNPQDTESFGDVFDRAVSPTPTMTPSRPPLEGDDGSIPDTPSATVLTGQREPQAKQEPSRPISALTGNQTVTKQIDDVPKAAKELGDIHSGGHQLTAMKYNPADALFGSVREVMRQLLRAQEPMKESEVAAALEVSLAQTKVWLQRLVAEGVVENPKRPAGYILKQSRLFE